MESEINSVRYLLENGPLTFEQKVLVKQNGRPTPDLDITYSSSSKTRTYNNVTKIFTINISGFVVVRS